MTAHTDGCVYPRKKKGSESITGSGSEKGVGVNYGIEQQDDRNHQP